MSEMTVTTKTRPIRNGREFVDTTWTVGGYRLIRTTETGTDYVRWSSQNDDHAAPGLYEIKNWNEPETVEYGVNWSAQGTQSVADARAYAQAITDAAAAAEAFTQIRSENA